MITNHQGLLLGVILLIIMSITCQLTNIFNQKDNFYDSHNNISVLKRRKNEDLIKLNDIKHINVENCRQNLVLILKNHMQKYHVLF